MKQIAFYGAFDRFNYGDMLFPIILEKALADWHPEYERRLYGIIKSDLSAYGGKPTESVESLFSENNLDDGSIVIVVGGEVLSPTWFEIYNCLVPETLEPMMKALHRSVPREYLRKIRPDLGKTNLVQPFVIDPLDFNRRVNIAFNSVGGVQISSPSYPRSLLRSLLSKLSNAAYLSVRDSKVRDFLIKTDTLQKPVLAPDSAHLIAKFFFKSELLQESNQELREWIKELNGNYLVFQTAQQYIKSREELQMVVSQIEDLYNTFGLPTALCPIGTAPGHKDQVALLEISETLRTPHIFLPTPSLIDIMTIISHSKAFLGTSLHGAITAMSFAVPNLIFSNRIPKLTAYIETWGLPELSIPVSINSVVADLSKILQLPSALLESKRDDLVELCLENLENLKTYVDNQLSIPSYGNLKVDSNRLAGLGAISTLSLKELFDLHQRFLKRIFRRLKRKILGN